MRVLITQKVSGHDQASDGGSGNWVSGNRVSRLRDWRRATVARSTHNSPPECLTQNSTNTPNVNSRRNPKVAHASAWWRCVRRDATASVPVVWKDVLTDEMVGEYEHVLLFDPGALAVRPET